MPLSLDTELLMTVSKARGLQPTEVFVFTLGEFLTEYAETEEDRRDVIETLEAGNFWEIDSEQAHYEVRVIVEMTEDEFAAELLRYQPGGDRYPANDETQ